MDEVRICSGTEDNCALWTPTSIAYLRRVLLTSSAVDRYLSLMAMNLQRGVTVVLSTFRNVKRLDRVYLHTSNINKVATSSIPKSCEEIQIPVPWGHVAG